MRPTALLILSLLTTSVPALAGVRAPGARNTPCIFPERSSVVLSGAALPCQYRFAANGVMDELAVLITLRDCFDVPVASCSLDVTLVPNAGTRSLCSCEGTMLGAMTNASGVADVRFARIGGRGSLDVAVTARCAGSIAIGIETIEFTTPDQNGSCESAPQASTTVLDLGLWAGGLSIYLSTSDFDCDGTVGVVDLAMFAAGLAVGCGD